jgi:hypothetical protein
MFAFHDAPGILGESVVRNIFETTNTPPLKAIPLQPRVETHGRKNRLPGPTLALSTINFTLNIVNLTFALYPKPAFSAKIAAPSDRQVVCLLHYLIYKQKED